MEGVARRGAEGAEEVARKGGVARRGAEDAEEVARKGGVARRGAGDAEEVARKEEKEAKGQREHRVKTLKYSFENHGRNIRLTVL